MDKSPSQNFMGFRGIGVYKEQILFLHRNQRTNGRRYFFYSIIFRTFFAAFIMSPERKRGSETNVGSQIKIQICFIFLLL